MLMLQLMLMLSLLELSLCLYPISQHSQCAETTVAAISKRSFLAVIEKTTEMTTPTTKSDGPAEQPPLIYFRWEQDHGKMEPPNQKETPAESLC